LLGKVNSSPKTIPPENTELGKKCFTAAAVVYSICYLRFI